MPARRKGRRAIEDPDVVEPQEAPLEDIHAFGVLAIHPPREVQEELVKRALEKFAIGPPGSLSIDLVDSPHRPGMNRWVDVAKCPLVGRDLAVRVHVPLAQEQSQLSLCELRVD